MTHLLGAKLGRASGRIGPAFAAGPVLHVWCVDADWYTEIVRHSKELAPARMSADDDPFDGRRERLEPADVERLALDLLDMEPFRAPRNRPTAPASPRHSATRCGSWRNRNGWDVHDVIRLANELAAQQSDERYAGLRSRFSQLAADRRFQRANNANLRRHAAEEFLTEHAGGYRPSTVDRRTVGNCWYVASP